MARCALTCSSTFTLWISSLAFGLSFEGINASALRTNIFPNDSNCFAATPIVVTFAKLAQIKNIPIKHLSRCWDFVSSSHRLVLQVVTAQAVGAALSHHIIAQ